MDILNMKNENDQLAKIVQSYNQDSLKNTLFLANYCKSQFPKLNDIPIFHNIIGLINLRLKDWDQSINNFETAININSNFVEAYYNLALVYFDKGKLENSYNYLIKSINIKKNYKKAKNKIIELLTFYQPANISDNYLSKLNEKIKGIPYNIDFSKKITDEQIKNYYERCKKIVEENLEDLSYNKYQIFKRKSVFLNCERHKGIFNESNTIPKYCFSCFKVVIKLKNLFDLIKVSLIFDQVNYFFNFNRKSLIDKRYGEISYKSLIYCSSIEEVYDVEKNTKNILGKIIGNNIVIESKRGCTEFALSFPNYKKIFKDKSKLMKYPDEWLINEKKFDEVNTKNNVETKRVIQDTITGFSLNNFLIINNWLND